MRSVVPASPRAFSHAARLLKQGRLVAFPTETVYGLGCDARNPTAVDQLYRVKNRPRSNPLILHIADLRQARALAHFGEKAERLARAFWPGALTLVLSPREGGGRLPRGVVSERTSIAVRIPSSAAALGVLEAFGGSIAAPSANRSQGLSPSQASHVVQAFHDSSEPALIIDGGACSMGLESSIVSLLEEARPRLLRPGAIEREALEAELGCSMLQPPQTEEGRSLSPGTGARHYAPQRPLRLNAVERNRALEAREAYIAFGAGERGDINLSVRGDLREAAQNLYSALHSLDRAPYSSIAVAPIPEVGLGEALNDRLRRAATPHTETRR